jgi:hypothetical protein
VVRPKPVVAVLCNAETTICNGKPFNQTLTSYPKGATFSVVKDNSEIGLRANARLDGLNFTVFNESKVQKSTDISLTPTLNGCVGPPQVLSIIVLPTPSVNQPADLVVCSGDSIPMVFSGAIAGTTFHWTNDNPLVGLASSGSGNLNQWTTRNETGVNQVVNMTVTPRLNGCDGLPKMFKMVVKPAPILRTTAFSFCANDNGEIDFKTNLKIPAETSFSWVCNNTNTGIPPAGNTNSLAFKAVSNKTNEPITAQLMVKAMVEGCAATTVVAVNVKPFPVLYNPGNIFIESGQRVNIHFTANIEGTKFDWTNSEMDIGLPRRGASDIRFVADFNASKRPIVANIAVTATLDGCAEQPQMFSITLQKTPSVTTPLATVQNALNK